MEVNEIEITIAETQKYQDQKIEIRLCWKVNGEYVAGYTGTYTAVLFENDTEFSSQDFTDAMGIQDITLEFADVKQEEKYKLLIKVPAEQGAAQSQEVDVINTVFDITEGFFDGSSAKISWKPANTSVKKGYYQLSFSNGTCVTNVFDASPGILRLDGNVFLNMVAGEYVDISLKRTDGEIVSTGLESVPLRFNASGISIQTGSLAAVDSGTELSLELYSVYKDLESGRISILYKETPMWVIDSIMLSPVENQPGYYTCKAVIPSEILDRMVLNRCKARLTIKYGCAETAIAGSADTLALQSPVISIRDVLSNGLSCRIEMPETDLPPYAFELASDTGLKTVGYTEFLWETSVVGQGGQVSARAKYRNGSVEQTGPFSEKVYLSVPGFYPSKDETGSLKLQYCMEHTEEGMNSLVLPAKLTAGLTEDVSSDLILLQKTDSRYILKVRTTGICTPGALEQFLLLLEGKMSPYAIYTIRDMVLRLASLSVKDTSELLCGWKKDVRRAYICPGTVLKISISAYMGQYASKVQTSAGFVNASTAYYPVTMDESDSCLVFDRFISDMGQNMTAGVSANEDTQLKYISSILDLSTGNARQPFYSILYPTELGSPQAPESAYAEDHVLLLASDSYTDLKTKLEMLDANPSLINSIQLMKFIVLGRSVLSLCIQVYFDNKMLYVPVGSTLGDVLAEKGIHSTDAVRMYRNDATGKKREVFLNLADGTEKIVLISGDNINCRSEG